MKKIIDVINIINSEYESLINEAEFCYVDRNLEDMFKNGCCYDYYLLLKRFFYDSKLMMKNDKTHCVIKVDEKLYDVTGVVEDKNNYHEATGCDMEYIFKYYDSMPVLLKEKLTSSVKKKVYQHN